MPQQYNGQMGQSDSRASDLAKEFFAGSSPAGQVPSASAPMDQGGDRAASLAAEFFGRPQPAATQHRASAPKAAAPARPVQKAPAGEEPSWGEAIQTGVSNLPSSIYGAGKAIAHSITNFPETAESLKQLATGAGSMAAGALGVQQDKAQKAKDEALINSLAEQYKHTYGSSRGFKEALMNDPASVLMDLSMALTGGGTAAAKLAGKTSTIARAGELAAKTGTMIDPVTGAVKLAKAAVAPIKTTKGVYKAAKTAVTGEKAASALPDASMAAYAAGRLPGVPASLIEVARQAGSTASDADRELFRRFIKGEGTAEEIHATAQDALNTLKKDASDQYIRRHKNLANRQIDFSPISDAINKAWQKANMGAGYPQRIEALQEIAEMVNRSDKTLENADALKRQIYELHNKYPNGTEAINDVYHAAKEAMSNPAYGGHKGYSDLMDYWQSHIRQMTDLKKSLGVGNNAASTNALAKMLKASKTPERQNLLGKLIDVRPELKYMLSGSSLSSWHPSVGQSIFDALVATPMFYLHPAAGFATMVGSSPRLIGESAYRFGQAEKIGSAIEKPAYAAGKIDEAQEQLGQPPAEEEASQEEPKVENVTPPTADVRSIRNNNMGNIIDSKWARNQPGYVGSDGKFAIFDSPESGKNAADKLLQNKADQGIDTARKLIDNWAPGAPHEYKELVARAAGASGVDAPINLASPAVRERVLAAIRWFEGDKRAAASGGRIERAAGGAVGRHEKLVNRLMTLAKQAKKGEEKSTEALLAQPDEAVVKALSVAQEAI